MINKLLKARRNVLIQLESILENECYDANVRNYGPGGVRETDGRAFRYPLTVRLSGQKKRKIRDHSMPGDISDEALRSGCYAFGVSQLDVMTALERMLRYLERHYGLIIK